MTLLRARRASQANRGAVVIPMVYSRLSVGRKPTRRTRWVGNFDVENQKGDKFKRVARTLTKLLLVGALRNTDLIRIPLFSFEI